MYIRGQEEQYEYDDHDFEFCGEGSLPQDVQTPGPRLVLLFNAGSQPGSGFKAYLNYTLSSTRWRLIRQQTACLSLWPDGQLHDNCAPSIGVVHPLRV